MAIKLAILFITACTAIQAFAQQNSESEAKWMLERLTGVKWSADSAVLAQMAERIQAGDRMGAAHIATAQDQFLNIIVKQMATQMSNRAEDLGQTLNDFSAAFIGVTRDQTDARELLYGDFFYSANLTTPLTGIRSDLSKDVLGSNNHYADLESKNMNYAQVLTRTEGQKIANTTTTSIPNPDPSGVLTSRAFLSEHAIGGTNRRLVEFSMREFACAPIQQWADTTATDARIGRDIDRFPSGDNQRFETTCKGCHSIMDGFRGAFSGWDFKTVNGLGDAAIHTSNGVTTGDLRPVVDTVDAGANKVVFKMNRPDFIMYAGGYITKDDSFVNNADHGKNATFFTWRGMAPDNSSMSGKTTGVHSFGRLLANTRRFSTCMAQRVWQSICRYSPTDQDAIVAAMGQRFEQQSYNLRSLFEDVAADTRCQVK